MILAVLSAIIDPFAAGVAAHPWLFAFMGASFACVVGMGANIADHQGWRAAGWGFAAAVCFGIGAALP